MNKLLLAVISIFLLFLFKGCDNNMRAYDESLITEGKDVPLVLEKEPSEYEIREVGNLNVLYQYGMPVPSFDTWETQEEGRYHLCLTGDWKFRFEDIPYEGSLYPATKEKEELLKNSAGMVEKWYSPLYGDEGWKTVQVPHVWDLEDLGDYDWFSYNTGQFDTDKAFQKEFGWYRKTFNIDKNFIKDRFVRLNSLGINTRAWIFINGRYAGVHDGAYEFFSMDVSKYLKEGENTIAVRVWRRPVRRGTKEGDFMGSPYKAYKDRQGTFGSTDPFSYGGIYREIWIESSNKAYVSKIVTRAEDGVLDMYAVLHNDSDMDRVIDIEFDPGTGDNKESEKIKLTAGEVKVVHKKIKIPGAKEWSYAAPNMYKGKVALKEKHNLTDSLSVKYGMRKIRIEDGKIYLNGNRILLKGFGWMEDFYDVARAIPKDLYEFHTDFIKNTLKANFLRNTHHPRNAMAYELANEYGLMIMEENAIVWIGEAAMTYQLYKYKLVEAMTASVVWNNINHPSIIMWSLMNEPSNVESRIMAQASKILNDITKRLDIQKRPTTLALRGEGQWWSNMAEHVDIFSFNQKRDRITTEEGGLLYKLEQIENRFPQKPIVFSESGNWTGNFTDKKEKEDIFRQWEVITSEQYNLIGFSMFTYNEYKNCNWSIEKTGISRYGVVNYRFCPEMKENGEKNNIPYMEYLGYHFKDLYNPYPYPAAK